MLTYKKAQEEVKILLNYINLIDNYKVESLEDLVIYKYAIYNSISKVIKTVNDENRNSNLNVYHITPDIVKSIIMNSPKDELHQIIRKQYLIKTRPQRRRSFK